MSYYLERRRTLVNKQKHLIAIIFIHSFHNAYGKPILVKSIKNLVVTFSVDNYFRLFS